MHEPHVATEIQSNEHRQFLAHFTAGIPRDFTTSRSDYFPLLHMYRMLSSINCFVTKLFISCAHFSLLASLVTRIDF